MCRTIGLALVSALAVTHAAAQPLGSYVHLSSAYNPHGKAGFAVRDGGMGLEADLAFASQNGRTTALPKIRSSFAVADALQVRTDLRLPNLAAASYGDTTSDTKISVRSLPPFIAQLEGRIRRSARGSEESVRLGFASMLDDAQVLGGSLNLHAALAVEDEGDERAVLPQLSSAVALGDALDVVTRFCLEESASSADCDHRFDTRFLVRGLPSFVDAFEGRVRRSADGVLRQSLKLGFSERFGNADTDQTPFTIQGKATFEQIALVDRPGARQFVLETVFAGFMPSLVPGRDKLSVRVESRSGVPHGRRTMLAYDHSWAAIRNLADVAFNLKLSRTAGTTLPSMAVSWDARF